ncbi:M15 family metallopeptidase [Mycobacterium sp. pW049]|uniref:M15 family metallopeptidase n=1 Tax=[Mycobacterium] bulgaricum TaxID=3238985 RepID=UPI00351AF148
MAALTVMAAALVQCAPTSNPAPPPSEPPPSEPSPAPAIPELPPETFSSVTPTPQAKPAVTSPVSVADLGTTWRPGCPAGPDELMRVDLDFWGFDGQTHRGRLVVHRSLTDRVIEVFDQLHRLRFPIEKMRTVDDYPGADDELSMRDNNTSAFNCRGIPGSDSWSLHAYGRAIDINPKLNPYVPSSGRYEPANAGPWVDRSRIEPGMLNDGDVAVRAFVDRGWRWGGHWQSPLDYQHFEIR